jgi:hypothetical protein
VAETWSESAPGWNKASDRVGRRRGRRSPRGGAIPEIAPFLVLDGQAFSDVGIPAALFIKNYDRNRTGHHTHDTSENIDLDFGVAVAAITIESVARAAMADPAD